jgi:uncharacterized protein YukE
VVAVGSQQRVLVGATAAQVASQFLDAARQLSTALAGVSSTAATLADQATWSGAAAQRFRADHEAMAAHLRAMAGSVQRMASGALEVIQTIDRDDAAGAAGAPPPLSLPPLPLPPIGVGAAGLPIQPTGGLQPAGASYVDGIRSSRGDDQPHLTVIGHSYGSLTTGIAAARDHLAADDIVLLGSPGTSVPHAGDLGVGDKHVWIGSASEDPVSQIVPRVGVFSADPALGSFGGTRFRAENPGIVGIDTVDPLNDHLHYYDPRSESLYNISQVVTSRYDHVITAPRRYDVLVPPTPPDPFPVQRIDPDGRLDVGHPTNPDRSGRQR